MLGGLQRDVDAGARAELPGPHAGAVHDVLALDVAVRGAHPRDRAPLVEETRDRHALDDGRALHARTPASDIVTSTGFA